MESFCEREGFAFWTYKKVVAFNPFAAWEIRRLCSKLKITHLHTHDAHAHTFAVLAASLFGNRAHVVVHRRVDFPIGKSFFSNWKYNHPSVKKIICVSRSIRDLIAPAIKDEAKLATVYSGVKLAQLAGDRLVARSKLGREFGLGGEETIVANIAALAPHKDYYTFVRTAGILLGQGLKARFLLIGGDGGEEQGVRRFIGQKGLEGQLILTGFRRDVPQLLPGIDVLLFTSKTEGLGTSLLDAFGAGVPVVATAAGGVPEIVEDGMTGLLAPVGDAAALARQVSRLLEDAPLRSKIIENARVKVRGFSKEKMAAAIVQIYQELAG